MNSALYQEMRDIACGKTDGASNALQDCYAAFKAYFKNTQEPIIVERINAGLSNSKMNQRLLSLSSSAEAGYMSRICAGKAGVMANLVAVYCSQVEYSSIHEWLFDERPTFTLPKNLSFLCYLLEQSSLQQKVMVEKAVMEEKAKILQKVMPWNTDYLYKDRYAAMCRDLFCTDMRILATGVVLYDATQTSILKHGRGLTAKEDYNLMNDMIENLRSTQSALVIKRVANYQKKAVQTPPLWFPLFMALRIGVPVDYLISTDYLAYANVQYSLEHGGVHRSMAPIDREMREITDLVILHILEHITDLPTHYQALLIGMALKMLKAQNPISA